MTPNKLYRQTKCQRRREVHFDAGGGGLSILINSFIYFHCQVHAAEVLLVNTMEAAILQWTAMPKWHRRGCSEAMLSHRMLLL